MAFSDNLRFYREKAGYLKAKDFAEKLGIAYDIYLNYENTETEPPYLTLARIAKELAVSADDLLDIACEKNDSLPTINPVEERTLNIIFNKSGGTSTGMTTRLTIPKAWIDELEISVEDRAVVAAFNGREIIVKKANSH